jgi:cytochrome P450
MLLYVALGLIVVYLVSLYYLNGETQEPNSPVFYRGWIPFLGGAFNIGTEGFAKFIETRTKLHGGIFAAHVLGQTHVYISEPECFSQVWKDPRFGFGPSLKQAGDRLRGFELESIKDNAELETRSEDLRKMTVAGLQGDELGKLTVLYQKLADDKIEDMTQSVTKFNLLDFTRRIIYTASAKALLEPGFDTEGTYEDFFYFDDVSQLVIIGVPKMFLPKVPKARDNVIKAIEKCNIEKLSNFIQHAAQREILQGHGEHKAYAMMAFLFASQTNSVNSSFWLLCYVLKNKHIKDRIMKEIQEFYDPNDYTTMDKMETLSNAFSEAARLAEGQFSFRDALEDASVVVGGKEYFIAKGSTVFLWPTTLLNDKLFENPHEFNPDRHKSLSKIAKQTLIPFGGGKHLCPGRYFAINEAKLFVISLLTRFECELDQVPLPELVRNNGGFFSPLKDIGITLIKRGSK